MARIRSIHPGLFTDEAFVGASPIARWLAIGILTECDDHGVFEWKPVTLKMRILPIDNVNVADLLEELEALSLLKRFAMDGKTYGAVRNFCRWQRPKTPQNVHPFPDDISAWVSFREIPEENESERGIALGRMLHEQQNGVCFYCETEISFYRKKLNSLEIDHKNPISRGGTDAVANLAATCRKCNSLKATMTDMEFLNKFAPSELRELHSSEKPKKHSQAPKPSSQIQFLPETEMPPQMEDEGRREGGKVEGEVSEEFINSDLASAACARETQRLVRNLGQSVRADPLYRERRPEPVKIRRKPPIPEPLRTVAEQLAALQQPDPPPKISPEMFDAMARASQENAAAGPETEAAA